MQQPEQQHFHLLEKVVLGRVKFQPPFKAASAFQDEARFVHVVKGTSRLYAAQSQYNLQSSNSALMRCENFVNNWIENEDDSQNEVIIIHFYPVVLHYIYDEKMPEVFSAKGQSFPQPVEIISINQMISHYIEGLRFYFDHPALMTEELLKVKVKELILILVNSDRSGRVKTILSDLFQLKDYGFKEIVHAHLFEDLNLEDLAFFAGLSLSSFKRKFKTVFGTSPGQYIKAKRLAKAKELLEQTVLRVSDIAYDCGFNDVGYFSKSFTSLYGLSPSEYRKVHLGQIS